MRMEFLFAMSDWRRFSSNGGKRPFDQFVRYHDDPREVTLEDIAKSFGIPYEVKTNGR